MVMHSAIATGRSPVAVHLRPRSECTGSAGKVKASMGISRAAVNKVRF